MEAKPSKISGYTNRFGKQVASHVAVRHVKGDVSGGGTGKPGVNFREAVHFLQEVAPRLNQENDAGLLVAVRDELVDMLGVSSSETGLETWNNLGFEVDERDKWIAKGVPLAEAYLWKKVGVDRYDDWRELAREKPGDVFHLKEIWGWSKANFTPDEFRVCAREGVRLSAAVSMRSMGDLSLVIPLVKKWDLNEKLIQKWLWNGVPLEDIGHWLSKGYTPLTASRLISSGVSWYDAKDLIGDAPVPGSAWKKIKRSADVSGWEKQGTEKVEAVFGTTTQVVFCRGEDTATVSFSPTGKFHYLKVTSPTKYSRIFENRVYRKTSEAESFFTGSQLPSAGGG